MKKYDLFALSRLLYIGKNFVRKSRVWTIRAILQNRAVFLSKNFFRKSMIVSLAPRNHRAVSEHSIEVH